MTDVDTVLNTQVEQITFIQNLKTVHITVSFTQYVIIRCIK